MSHPPETKGLKVSDVRLVHCQFERHSLEPAEGDRSLDYDVAMEFQDLPGPPHVMHARQRVRVSGKCAGVEEWTCTTGFVATLTIAELSDISIDQARKSIAPAILYGFAREHIFDLARRAGIGGAFMPPLNFMTQ